MKVYLVGGAVRDSLLGIDPKEHDWVVVGATPAEMKQLGYKQVGKDFPVFLHPQTHDEYALARTERKINPGYTGFDTNATPNVSLESDLKRRDLTINAIAKDEDGQLIDPFNGRSDLENKILRHVSPAFVEDPVRILRVGRFAAYLANHGFVVADETNTLMQQMVESGEVDALVPERVWKEVERALASDQPQRFFEVLRDCGALKQLFPEIDRLFGVPQTAKHHPEIDTGVHTMMVVQQAARLTKDTQVRFAALVHDLGKGVTPSSEWPKHIAHEQRGIPLVRDLCKRLRAPNDYRRLAVDVTRYHLYYHRAEELTPTSFLKLFKALNSFHKAYRLEQFLLACEADSRGRLGYEDADHPLGDIFRNAHKAAAAVRSDELVNRGLSGKEIGTALHKLRIEAIKAVLT